MKTQLNIQNFRTEIYKIEITFNRFIKGCNEEQFYIIRNWAVLLLINLNRFYSSLLGQNKYNEDNNYLKSVKYSIMTTEFKK